MRLSVWAAVLALVGVFGVAGVAREQADGSGSGQERMAWWRAARLGLFVHWGLYAIPAGVWGDKTNHGEWIMSTAQIPIEKYEEFRGKFNPKGFDADGLVRAAKDAGMGYLVITTKHHDGFCLFDSKVTDYDVMSTPFRRDVMREVADACRKHGVKVGWYYSIMDWHHPDYLPRRPWETRTASGADFERYVAYMKAQLRELLTNYGEIDVLWFDGQWEGTWNDERGRDLEAFVRGVSPKTIINSRVGRGGGQWGLDPGALGDYGTPEQEIPVSAPPGDWETCMTMNGHWGFNRADTAFKPAAELLAKTAEIASKGGNFLINVGPDAGGRVPAASLERLSAMGAWMRERGESIRSTRRSFLAQKPGWGVMTWRAEGGRSRVFLHVLPAGQGPAAGGATLEKAGALRVPGLLSVPSGARVLGRPELKPTWKREGDDLVVTVDGLAAPVLPEVVELVIDGEPDAANPPEIETDAETFIDRTEARVVLRQREGEVRAGFVNVRGEAELKPVQGPVAVEASATLVAQTFRDGKPVGPQARRRFYKVTPRFSLVPEVRGVGSVMADTYEGAFKTIDEMLEADPVATVPARGVDLSVRTRQENFGVRFVGMVRAPKTGVYKFFCASDDGSRVVVDGVKVVDNDGPHSLREESGVIALGEGWHPIEVVFFENTGGFELKVAWSGPGFAKRALMPEDLGTLK